MALSVTDIRETLDLMEASETPVFFRFTTDKGASGKTPVMSPVAAREFLDVSEMVGTVFSFIWMGREEQY